MPELNRNERLLVTFILAVLFAGVVLSFLVKKFHWVESVYLCSQPDYFRKKININTASARELESLPSIGAKKAQAIIELRQSRGGSFSSIDELVEVKGISKKLIAGLKPFLQEMATGE